MNFFKERGEGLRLGVFGFSAFDDDFSGICFFASDFIAEVGYAERFFVESGWLGRFFFYLADWGTSQF